MYTFKDKTVVVTGAAGALGAAVAATFHTSGAEVIGLDIVEHRASYKMYQVDLLDRESVKTVLESIDRVDVLCNIAGGFTMGETVAQTNDATWDHMMNLNVTTCLNTIRVVVPDMQSRQFGKIINVGAFAGLSGHPKMSAYCASKSAVIRLTESLAAELKYEGINVNCILPSIIDTPQNRKEMPSAKFECWVKPDALARVVRFLASPEADPIHGAALPVVGLV